MKTWNTNWKYFMRQSYPQGAITSQLGWVQHGLWVYSFVIENVEVYHNVKSNWEFDVRVLRSLHSMTSPHWFIKKTSFQRVTLFQFRRIKEMLILIWASTCHCISNFNFLNKRHLMCFMEHNGHAIFFSSHARLISLDEMRWAQWILICSFFSLSILPSYLFVI